MHRIGRTGRAGRDGVAITLAEPREHRLLRNIERVTKQKIEIATVPTVADLRARRLETTRARCARRWPAARSTRIARIVESLAAEFDVMDVAAAAVKRAEPAARTPEEDDIPGAAGRGTSASRDPRAARRRSGPGRRARDAMRTWRGIFIGGGRALRITPADLVGAIANEAGISGRAIGAIQIDERHSTVEVPDDRIDDVVAALRATTSRASG